MTTKEKRVSFSVTREDGDLINQIADRAMGFGHYSNKLEGVMDLTAVHANDCKLNLSTLLAWADDDKASFSHDVCGIRNWIDRETGKLGGTFVPRSAKSNQPEGGA